MPLQFLSLLRGPLAEMSMVTSASLSLLLLGLEVMTDKKFSCPCKLHYNQAIAFLICFAPAIVVLAIMLFSLRPFKYKRKCDWEKKKCCFRENQNNSGTSQGDDKRGTSQSEINENEEEDLSCEKTFIVCLIPSLVWICLWFIDGDYLACGLTYWDGHYTRDKELNWCKPNDLSQDNTAYEDTKEWINISKILGYSLTSFFSLVAIYILDCCKSGKSTCCRKTDPETQSHGSQGSASQMATYSPYSRPEPLKCKCIATQVTTKAISFVKCGEKIIVGQQKVTAFSVVTDGSNTYLCSKNGETPEFDEGVSYLVKNHYISNKYGKPTIFMKTTTKKFKTAPLTLTEEQENKAKEMLVPRSPLVQVDDVNPTEEGYVSLLGEIEELQTVRMAQVQSGQVPVLDLKLSGGPGVEVTLWRDEALVELFKGDTVELTHLRSSLKSNETIPKFHTSNHTTVKIAERRVIEELVEVVGVSTGTDKVVLLGAAYEEYTVASSVYSINTEELISQLPLKMTIKHVNNRVLSITN